MTTPTHDTTSPTREEVEPRFDPAVLGLLVDRLPVFDPTWPAEQIEQWFSWFQNLWRAAAIRAEMEKM